MDQSMPATLGEAIATEPMWLQGWVTALVVVHLAALAFIVTRVHGVWRVRYQPFAILASFFLAGAFMGWLYEQVGYVRLLGLAHLVFWTPVYVWVWRTRNREAGTVYAKYLLVYLVIAGLSRFHAINSALEVDLTGQIGSEQVAGRDLGAVGRQVDYQRGAMLSPGGASGLGREPINGISLSCLS